MTTGELVEALKKEDPTGKLPVCVGNGDVWFLEEQPAYYDGKLQRLITDPNKYGYNIVGAKWVSSGKKVRIHTMGVGDAIENNPDVRIDYTELVLYGCGTDRAGEQKKHDDASRAETRRIWKEVDNEEAIRKGKKVWDFYEI